MTIPFPEHAWPLLKRALEHIAEHPGSFYMPSWVVRLGDEASPLRGTEMAEEVTKVTGLPLPACGTVACLAGWVVLLDGSAYEPNDETALLVLGLSTDWNYVDGDRLYRDPISQALTEVFVDESISSYAELAEALTDVFDFPEPLPAVPAVTP